MFCLSEQIFEFAAEDLGNFDQVARTRSFAGALPAADGRVRAADALGKLGLSQAALDAQTGDGALMGN